MKKLPKILLFLLSAVFALSAFTACDDLGDTLGTLGEIADLAGEVLEEIDDGLTSETEQGTAQDPNQGENIDENGSYTSKEDAALYIHTYGKLPQNFITKSEAQNLGWEGGGLEDYAPGKCIGGDYFGNYEGLLPQKDGRKYTECDVDTLGKSSRGAKRIVFSNDGLIYYTPDHYETFELLYGQER